MLENEGTDTEVYSEEEFRIFMGSVDNSSDAVGMSTPEGRHYYQNKAFDALFGDIGEDPPASIYVDHEVGLDVFRTIKAGGQWAGEVRMYGRDGKILVIFLRAYASKDKAGRINALVGLHTDITETKKAQQELAESKELLTLFMKHCPVYAYIKEVSNGESRIVQASENFIDIFGITGSEMSGKVLSEFLPPDLAQKYTDLDVEVVENGKVTSYEDIRGGRYYSTIKFPIPKKGKSFLAGFTIDITEQKIAELALMDAHSRLEQLVKERTNALESAKAQLECELATLRKTEEEKAALEGKLRQAQVMEVVGQLAGGVAHDFNNMLASILSCLYNTRGQVAGDAALMDEIRRMEDLCKQGADLTYRLLSFSRRIPGRQEVIDICEYIFELKMLLERTLPKHIHIEVKLPPLPSHIKADRSMLTAALLNVVNNARDAMPHGGRLEISAEVGCSSDGVTEVQLHVADSGTGIPEAILDRLFEPFFTTKSVGRGTGLGLSMVYAFMNECGGEVSIASKFGEGTTVSLMFKAFAGPANAVPTTRSGYAGTHPLTRKPILVVEDEETILKFIRMVLEDHGYNVLCSRSGVEALEVIEKTKREVGLVVLDFIVPHMGGNKLYRILRGLAPELPILFLTGRPDLARELDANAPILAKPFTEENLLEAIADVILP